MSPATRRPASDLGPRYHHIMTFGQMRQAFAECKSEQSLAKMESRPPSTDTLMLPEEAIFRVSSVTYEPPFIKIASHIGGRDVSDNVNWRNHFRRAPFPFCPFSFGRAKENGQTSSNIYPQEYSGHPTHVERSFFCLDTKERTKEKIKAGEKMAKNFFAALKRIRYASDLRLTGDKYSFLNAPLRNFLNAIFSQAILKHTQATNVLQTPRKVLGGLRQSFGRHRASIYILFDICLPWATLLTLLTALGLIF